MAKVWDPYRGIEFPKSIERNLQGIDLSAPLTPQTVADISAALVRYKVLFFCEQDMTTEQQLAFARQFGPLEIHPFTEGSSDFVNRDQHPEVLTIESTEQKPASANYWHSDVTWRQTPSLGSVLRAVIVPPYGGDTLWANMAAAYEGLPDAMQQRLSGMEALHDWEGFRRKLRANQVPEEKINALMEQYPVATHPVVRTHPVSGEKIIYVNRVFTTAIKDMAEVESNALLEQLYVLASIPEYQVRFQWQPGSVAFWDNRSTQHYAVADFYPQHRQMARVTIAGDKPF